MGKICQRTRFYNTIKALAVGSACGILLCIILILLLRKKCSFNTKTTKRRSIKKPYRNTLIDDERTDFLRQLDSLRPHADHFLAMLNDIRRQIRKHHAAGDTVGAKSYYSVVCDLAKLLIILNKPNEVIPQPPSDWNRLSGWAEYIMLEQHHPLIDSHEGLSFSTFKTNITRTTATTSDSSNEQQNNNPFGSLISLQDIGPVNGGSSLWLEDEFFKLGFRPQDEITTEL